MASVKELKTRIASVTATHKITKAMQMVAAAKLRRARDAAESARPYATRMAAVIANLAAGISGDGAPRMLVGTGSQSRELVVVATSDKGLAGGFNSSIVRVRPRLHRRAACRGPADLGPAGRAARRATSLGALYGDRFLAMPEAGTPSLDKAQEISDLITHRFEAGEIDVVTLFYNRFASVVSQVPTRQQLIPAQIAGAAPTIDLKGAAYEYEPDEETILAALLPRNLTTQILGRHAGEPGRLLRLPDGGDGQRHPQRRRDDRQSQLIMNRTRQAQITKELIEIISGAEAL